MKDFDRLVICKKCIEDFKNVPYSTPFQYRGFFTNFKVPDDGICSLCKEQLYETNITGKEIKILFTISHDNDFLQSMIVLKETDPIEYQLKMSQFKTNLSQTQKQESNQIKCPTCSAANIEKIGGLERGASVAMFGLFSKKIKKHLSVKTVDTHGNQIIKNHILSILFNTQKHTIKY